MNKFNKAQRNLARERRHKRSQEKRLRTGLATLKISTAPPPRTLSGKAQRKLEKKWRRSQKEAIESGLVTMEDIEMMAADSTPDALKPSKTKGIVVKKRLKLKPRKRSGAAAPAAAAAVAKPADAPERMEE